MHYVTIFLYFLILLVIGGLAARRVRNLGDYYVGGKRLGYWVVVFSARASGESAWLYLGLTGLGAFVGLRGLWVVVGECLGVGIAWFFMATPFKQATDRFGSITVPDYLVSRFADTTRSERTGVWLRVVSAGLLSVFVTIYVSAQIDATGTAFENFLDWNYYVGAVFGFVIVVAYTSWGGFVAVAWSDLLQGFLMLVGLAVLPIAAVLSMPPGTSLVEELAGMGEGLLSLWGPGGASLSNVLIIVSYLAIGLGFLGSPQVFVRFMSIRDAGEIRAGRWIAIAFTVITDTGAVLAGLFGRYLVVGADDDPEALFGAGTVLGPSGQNVLPLMVEQLFPSLVVGFYIAAVLAATMSTIDSLLVVASSSLTRDVYQKILKPDVSDERLFRLSRRVTVGLAAVALCLSLTVAVAVRDAPSSGS